MVLDRICWHAYVLGLVLAVLTAVLTPLHLLNVQRTNVSATRPANQFEVNAVQLSAADVGGEVKVWRFNPGWMIPIGTATVADRQTESVVLSYDPNAFAWPLGRQGTVVDRAEQGNEVTLNIGSEVGLQPGNHLNLFNGRKRVGRIQVATVSDRSSTARVLQIHNEIGDRADTSSTMGLTASEFTIPNQVTTLRLAWMPGIEFFVIVGALGLWVWSLFSPVPGQRAEALIRRVRTAVEGLPDGARTFWWVLYGVPACFVGLQMVIWWLAAAPSNAVGAYRQISDYWILSWFPSKSLRADIVPYNHHTIDPNNVLVLCGVALGIWVVMLMATSHHPLWTVLKALRYRKENAVIYRLFSWMPKGTLNWILHLVVFYLFAINLFNFLSNNMAAAATAGWPGANGDFSTVSAGLRTTGYMLTHLPALNSLNDFFTVSRYLTWSACIVGCLIGYGHTILSILWKKEPIRWIDFTLTGWFVNLLCYGVWSNAVFRVFPHPAGADPAIVGGPLMVLQPTAELYLNVVYTLSIFNMGTKFGVMVDKGLVDKGFYSVVRHPSYTLEALMFSVLYLNRVTQPWAALGLLAHPFMYWWRSERDDHFMGVANEEYPEYRKRVKWKYIPGIW